jgi:hypothetical protein
VPSEEKGHETIASPSGMWINKRGVAALGFPFAHTYTETEAGWELAAAEPGELVLRFLDGATQSVPLSAGDRLIASADDVYVAAQAAPQPGGGGGKDDDGRRQSS